MLYEFLLKFEKAILDETEKSTLQLAGARPSSEQLKKGLPIFYKQLLRVLKTESKNRGSTVEKNSPRMADAARRNDEPAVTAASSHPDEESLANEAGMHGVELLRLGYTLSHVVHAYGSMCQAITELAAKNNAAITADEFHDLNRCLDVAIAGAVTAYQNLRNTEVTGQETERLGFLAHELRNALGTVTMSLDLIKEGTVGFKGNTGRVLENGLKRIEDLVDRSLTEVRFRVEPKVSPEPVKLLLIVDQILLTASIKARSKKQVLDIQVSPDLVVVGDKQLIHSAISNLIQNSIKYTRPGGLIQIRAGSAAGTVTFEVEDECGGLKAPAEELFKPYEQQNENREGIGLGLSIARRAITLNHGTINVTDLPGKGCIFKITLPEKTKEATESRPPEVNS